MWTRWPPSPRRDRGVDVGIARLELHVIARLRLADDEAAALEQHVGADDGGDAELALLAGLAHGLETVAVAEDAAADLAFDVVGERLVELHGARFRSSTTGFGGCASLWAVVPLESPPIGERSNAGLAISAPVE